MSSYGINNIDIHYGLGWGTMNGSKDNIKNPLGYINNSFRVRPDGYKGQGGQFSLLDIFWNKASPFMEHPMLSMKIL